jgi:hypothetical protein
MNMRTIKLPFLMTVFCCTVILTAPLIHCKKSSTAPEVNPPEQKVTSITLTCSPSSGGTDTNFSVTVSINNSDREIKVFGLEMIFDADIFKLRRIEAGNLTESWAAVDGNEIKKGTLRVGGFAGSGNPIPTGNTGDIAEVKFKVTGNNFNNGQQSQIRIESYTDDIASMTPLPSVTSFTLNK